MRGNGKHEGEHPKALVEVMGNTREAIEGYAAAAGTERAEAALILILNELRCIHWHLDQWTPRQQAKAGEPK